MFDSFENTVLANRTAKARGKILGTHVAELAMLPEHGKFELNPVNGHCSWWFYEATDFEKIECLQIISINEDS